MYSIYNKEDHVTLQIACSRSFIHAPTCRLAVESIHTWSFSPKVRFRGYGAFENNLGMMH